MIHITITHPLLLGCRVLLDMRLWVREVGCSGRITATNRALDKVALQDIRARECVPAEHTHVRSVTRMSEKMALQMLRMQVSLCAVRAGKLSVCVLGRDSSLAGSSCGRSSRSSRRTGQDTAASLRAHNMGWCFAFLQHALLCHQRALAIRRVHACLRHHSRCWHWSQNRRGAAGSLQARGRRRRNWLRMRGRAGGGDR